MHRRLTVVFIVFAILGAALFARLGWWQVTRLRERQAFNATVAGRLDSSEVAFAELPRDPASARFRRVHVEGTWDAAHEVVLVNRSRNGSPGVHLLTPLRVAGSDTAVLVNRGWVYAPDAANVADRGRWRVPTDTARVSGFVVSFPALASASATAGEPPLLRTVDPEALARWTGYPVHAFQLVEQRADTLARRDSTPAAIAPPPLDEGSHRGYAFQWFTFALIALVGVPVFVLTRGRESEKANRVPPAPPTPSSPPGRTGPRRV